MGCFRGNMLFVEREPVAASLACGRRGLSSLDGDADLDFVEAPPRWLRYKKEEEEEL